MYLPQISLSKATEIEWRYLEDGSEVRVSKRTGRIINKAPEAENTWEDYTNVSKYIGKFASSSCINIWVATRRPVTCLISLRNFAHAIYRYFFSAVEIENFIRKKNDVF